MVGAWPFDVRVRPVRDGVAIVSVVGEIDLATVPILHKALAPVASDPAVRLLVCDLSSVAFFGCSGVSVLLDTRAVLVARGARLRLVADTHAVLRPLGVTGLLGVLPVSPTLPSALR
jgi:anti-sigma B factor antagonist